MRSLLVVALAGCGRIGFGAANLAGDAESDVPVAVDASNCTTYTFDPPALPTDLIEFGTGGIALDGQLQCSIPGSPGASCGVQTSPNFSFHDRSIAIHMVRITSSNALNGPGWHSNLGSVHFFLTPTTIQLTDGTAMITDVYNPTEHAWVRLRETPGTIHGEVSADGMTWNPFGTVNSFDLSSAYLDLGSDNTGTNGPADSSVFDDLVVCPPF